MARLNTLSICLLALELSIATAAVILFGMAYPDRFRSRLWANGGEEGWNSNPNQRIYFYANHREPPEIPLIWSQRLTDSNLAVSILGLVVFFSRAATSHLSYLPASADVLYDVLLAALWTVSLAGQASGDGSDAAHPSARPWYLTRSCSEAVAENRDGCRVAQASFGVSVVAVGMYFGRLVGGVVCRWRGGERGEGWVVVDGEDKFEDESEGEKYVDEERGVVARDEVDQALSPVLAFFPSGSGHLGRE